MFHLFQHQKGKLKGKYDFAFVKNGKYICGSNQGYENKKDVHKAIWAVATSNSGFFLYIQDDTGVKAVVLYLVRNVPLKNIITSVVDIKPKKKYIP